jgi:hypothetical protein
MEKLKVYLNYLDSIDVAYYSAINRNKGLSKVIILPLDECITVSLAFTCPEFETLKKIIRGYLSGKQKSTDQYLTSDEFRMLNLN